MAVLELVGPEGLLGNGDVLLLATGVGKAEVDELHLLVLDLLQDIGASGHEVSLLLTVAAKAGVWVVKRAGRYRLAINMPSVILPQVIVCK